MSEPPLQPLAGPSEADLPETVVSCDPKIRFIQSLRDLWAYRDLFRAFLVRDIKVRYKQTALGVVWVILQPLAASGLFALIFRNIGARADASALESLLFFMAALTPWTSFAAAVQSSATSMEVNAGMISKIYFPRMIVPGAHVCGSILDFLIAFAVLLALAGLNGILSPALVLWMPPLLLIQIAAALGLGLFFGILNAQYRDVKYVVPFLLQMGMFLTALVPLADWSPPVRQVLACNPMAAVIETYRALFESRSVDLLLLLRGALVSLILLVAGITFFRAREAKLVDIL